MLACAKLSDCEQFRTDKFTSSPHVNKIHFRMFRAGSRFFTIELDQFNSVWILNSDCHVYNNEKLTFFQRLFNYRKAMLDVILKWEWKEIKLRKRPTNKRQFQIIQWFSHIILNERGKKELSFKNEINIQG